MEGREERRIGEGERDQRKGKGGNEESTGRETCTHEPLDFIVRYATFLITYHRLELCCASKFQFAVFYVVVAPSIEYDRPFYCTYRLWHECGVMLQIDVGRFVTFQ